MRSLNEKDLIQSLGVGEKQQMEAAPVSENQNKWKSRETPLTVLWCMRRHHHHTKSQRVLIPVILLLTVCIIYTQRPANKTQTHKMKNTSQLQGAESQLTLCSELNVLTTQDFQQQKKVTPNCSATTPPPLIYRN